MTTLPTFLLAAATVVSGAVDKDRRPTSLLTAPEFAVTLVENPAGPTDSEPLAEDTVWVSLNSYGWKGPKQKEPLWTKRGFVSFRPAGDASSGELVTQGEKPAEYLKIQMVGAKSKAGTPRKTFFAGSAPPRTVAEKPNLATDHAEVRVLVVEKDAKSFKLSQPAVWVVIGGSGTIQKPEGIPPIAKGTATVWYTKADESVSVTPKSGPMRILLLARRAPR